MAAARGEGLPGPPLLPALLAALALLGLLVYVGALCAACRRQGRRKKVPPDGVKLVDESLLRQTQLRSLSKSDTKLHELYRVKARDDNQRPASLDFPPASAPPGPDSLHSSGVSVLLHRELPQIPVPEPPAPDQTYSNLLFAPPRRPAQDTVYECLAVGGDDAPAPPAPTGTRVSPPQARRGAGDYACVRKVKKTVPGEEQEGAVAGPPAAPRCWEGAGNAPPQLKVEDMYSTVCKATKKKSQGPAASPRAAGQGGAGQLPPAQEEPPPAGCWSAAPPEPCYESINERAWTARARGPDPDYEAVDVTWKKPAKRDKAGKPSPHENLYESVGEIWAGESRRASGRPAANGLEVYITNL